VTVTPTAGSVGVRLRSYTSATARTLTAASERGTAFTVRWAGLTPGDEYVIRVDGRVLSRVRADAGGVVSWSYTETAGAERAFTVRTS
jgi:hypothetical protein